MPRSFLIPFLAVIFLLTTSASVESSVVKTKIDKKITQTVTIPSNIQDKKVLGKYGYWTVLSGTFNSNKICYAVLYPKKTLGNLKKSSVKTYIDIDYISDTKQRFTIHFPKNLRQNSVVHVNFDSNKQMILDSFDDIAFFTYFADNDAILSELTKYVTMKARSEYENNLYAVDEFDISSFSGALNKMRQACL